MNFEQKDGEPDQMRCASYLRIASDMAGQAALEDQEQHCRRFAEEHGWIVPDEYVYTDAGKSGSSPAGRDGLNSLIIAAKKQPSPFQMVLVEETSRLARNSRDVLDIVDALALHGVHVYFINQNLDSRDDHFRMMLMLPEMVEEQYIARLSDKVWRGQMGRVISGLTSGGRCFGYGAIVRCFRVHADLLDTQILVKKVPDPATQGRSNLYRLQLKDEVTEKLTPAA